MANTTNRQASVDSRRVTLEREIAIRVPRFDTFVTEYSSNISTTGMFIVSDSPQPPGTTFSFEFSVADDWKLIRGKAQVVWTRYRDEGPERPSGMGIRFLEVDAQSRRLIRWIVEKHIREGGKPFELDELRSVIDQALEQVLDTEEGTTGPAKPPPQPAPPKKPSPAPSVNSAAARAVPTKADRNAWPLLATAGAVLLTVAVLFWLTEVIPGKQPAPRSTDAAAAGIGSDQPPDANSGEAAGNASMLASGGTESAVPTSGSAGASASEAGEQVEQLSPPVGSAYESVLDAVTAWADAWSDQDAGAYLAAYSASFTPAGGLSRRQWEAQRRERLARPGFIKVSISGLEIDRISDTLVRVTFSQSYRSDRFNDLVRKTMSLVWEDGQWKIDSETAA